MSEQANPIQTYEIEYVNIDDLKFDPDNPNQLTDKEMHGLSESFKRFGYLSPIVIDQNNLIADGEHRAAVYKKFNMQQIPAYRLHFENDIERRLLRQSMNKLRGQHNYELDMKELEFIYSRDKEALQTLLSIGEEDFKSMQQFVNVSDQINDEILEPQLDDSKVGYQGLAEHMPQQFYDKDGRLVDPSTIAHHANTFLYGNIKQIMVYFTNQEYQSVIERAQDIMVTNNLKNHTDLFKFLLEYYEQQNVSCEYQADSDNKEID